jgi:hypothetical protein
VTVVRATVHVSGTDIEMTGTFEAISDVLSLSSVTDNKSAPLQETQQGHAVRIGPDGLLTHVTALNARFLLDHEGCLDITLRDGRHVRLTQDDIAWIAVTRMNS